MLAPISRAVSARAVSRVAQIQMRTFIVPTLARRADFVQDLYLRELKSYKAPQVKDSDATGHVATFSLPKAPKSPEEADLASSLKEYETMAVEVEGQDAAAQAPGAAAPVLEDWLVDEEDEAESGRPVAGATH
ncbi:ATP synthase complex subunit H [Coniochaeta sp. 2T2.1]|nr:ATP synthase complex subunit H [Coniochaeta sp. 2T2.1]